MNQQASSLQTIADRIFRAYDIRGHADHDLSDEMVSCIAQALVTLAKRHGYQTAIVGCDARLSSPRITERLQTIFLEQGLNVDDIGQVPTPLLYYAAQQGQGFGIMVTASHNPKDDNGFKIVLDNKALSPENLDQLKQDTLAASNQNPAANQHRGQHRTLDMVTPYIEHVTSLHPCKRRIKAVVDAGNGIGGVVGPKLLTTMGIDVVPLYCELDGRFPNHHPNPGDERTLSDLIDRVKAENADIGLAFDGDADRLGVVTNTGEIIRPDRLLMWYAEDLLRRQPGAPIVYDVKCTRHLTRVIENHGGTPIMWKTGHAHIKHKMRELKAPLAGEMSGHLFFGESWYGFDDACFAAAKVCQLLAQGEQSASEHFQRFPNAVSTAEILIAIPDAEKFSLMERLAQQLHFEGATATTIDGIRLDFEDGWGLIRASNTTANLTCRFEADDRKSLKRIMTLMADSFRLVDERIALDVDHELSYVPEVVAA